MIRPDLKRNNFVYVVGGGWVGGGGGGGVNPRGFSEQFSTRKLKNSRVWKEIFSCSSNRNAYAYAI